MRVGLVLQSPAEIGGVASWCQDLALYRSRSFDVVAVLLESQHAQFEPDISPAPDTSESVGNCLTAEEKAHSPCNVATASNGAYEKDVTPLNEAFRAFDEVIVLPFPHGSEDHWSLQCDVDGIDWLPVHARLIGQRIDILVPNQYEYGFKLGAYLLSSHPRLRVIGVCHTDESYYLHLQRKYARILSAVIAVCTQSQHRLAGYGIRAIHVPYGVPDFAAPSDQRIKRSPLFTIGYVGRLCERQKKVSRLLLLAENIVRAKLPVSLLVCGDGEEHDALYTALRKKAISLTWTGPRHRMDMAGVYAQIDALILVSDTEGTPLAMLEAMSAGVVPLMPDIAGIGDTIVHGQNGFLYPRGDMNALSAQIATLSNQNILNNSDFSQDAVASAGKNRMASHATSTCGDIHHLHYLHRAATRSTYLSRYSLATHISALHQVFLQATNMTHIDTLDALAVIADHRSMRWHLDVLRDTSTLDT